MGYQAARAGLSWLSLSLRSETGNAVMTSIDHLQYLTTEFIPVLLTPARKEQPLSMFSDASLGQLTQG